MSEEEKRKVLLKTEALGFAEFLIDNFSAGELQVINLEEQYKDFKSIECDAKSDFYSINMG